jgi:hypothetical protein
MRRRVGSTLLPIRSCALCPGGNAMCSAILFCGRAVAVRDVWLRVGWIVLGLPSLKLLTMVTCDCARRGLDDSIRSGCSFTKDSGSEF